jgi:hypothetical protein
LVPKPPCNITEGKSLAAVGFSAPAYAGLSNLFAASYCHCVSPDVEAGANTISPTVTLAVGTKAHA